MLLNFMIDFSQLAVILFHLLMNFGELIQDIMNLIYFYMVVQVKNFIQLTRCDCFKIKITNRNGKKSFKGSVLSFNALSTKNKIFGIHLYRGFFSFPIFQPEDSSFNNSPQVYSDPFLCRLYSFLDGWPLSSSLSPMYMARAGYYYTGVKDFVVCHRCRFKRQPSAEGIEEFKRNSDCKRCSFLEGNVQRPIQRSYDSLMQRLLSFVEGCWRFHLSPISLANAGYYFTGVQNMIACSHCRTIRQLSIEGIEEFKKDLSCRKCNADKRDRVNASNNANHQETIIRNSEDNFPDAAYPFYSQEATRLESFVNWPHTICTPSELAKAGFFYAGYADSVRCFHCGLGLKSWEPGDDIYTEHERYRPTCQFLQSSLHQRKLNSSAPKENTTEDHKLSTVSKLLQQENEELQLCTKCKVCKMAPFKILFLPCGHLYACENCSRLLTHCLLCEKPILATVTTYLT